MDVFGITAKSKELSYPYLFSLKIKNLGKGSNKKFPKVYSSFYDNDGSVLFSPRNIPLKNWENATTKQISFDFMLPGAIDAVINPGWNYLSKSLGEESRWQGSIKIESGDAKLDVKYDDGKYFETLLEWVNNDL